MYIASLILLSLLFVFPYLKHFNISGTLLTENINKINTTLFYTVLNAIITAALLTLVSFAGALMIKDVTQFSRLGKWLSLLILPVTLGNISVAFICKLILGDTALFMNIAQQNISCKLVFLDLLQLWQFGLLFLYLCWLHFQSVKPAKLIYARVNGFSFYQSVKDIYLPHSCNLLILLSALGFIFTFYEEAKLQYLFKVSQGTNSELIANWLSRNYQSALLVNPTYARDLLFTSGSLVALAAFFCMGTLYFVGNLLGKISARTKFYPKQRLRGFRLNGTGRVSAGFMLLFVLAPIALSIAKIRFELSSSLLTLGFPIAMTLLATILAVIAAISFGICARVGYKVLLSSFNNRSLLFFLLFFTLMLIPPIILLVSGYKWMGYLGYHSESMVYIIWLLGHAILTLPVMGSFVLFNHFQVSSKELDYQFISAIPITSIIRFSFMARFKGQYFFLFIICFSFIWNEATLNSLFSDYIPSFAVNLKMLLTGRSADYSLAFGYLSVSLLLGAIAVIVWYQIINKQYQSRENL